MDADVTKAEMMLSESDSKFVHCYGWRETFTIENSFTSDSKFIYGVNFPRSVHFSIKDIYCDDTCPVNCPSQFQKFQFKNGELVKMADENKIGQGGFGSVFKGLFHGKEKAMKCVLIGQIGSREFKEHSAAGLERNISEIRIQIACAGAGIIVPEAFVRQLKQEQDENGKWIAKNYNIYIYPLYDCNLYELHENHFDNFTETTVGEIIHQCFIRYGFKSTCILVLTMTHSL